MTADDLDRICRDLDSIRNELRAGARDLERKLALCRDALRQSDDYVLRGKCHCTAADRHACERCTILGENKQALDLTK